MLCGLSILKKSMCYKTDADAGVIGMRNALWNFLFSALLAYRHNRQEKKTLEVGIGIYLNITFFLEQWLFVVYGINCIGQIHYSTIKFIGFRYY